MQILAKSTLDSDDRHKFGRFLAGSQDEAWAREHLAKIAPRAVEGDRGNVEPEIVAPPEVSPPPPPPRRPKTTAPPVVTEVSRTKRGRRHSQNHLDADFDYS